jgi:hypothetical protein
MIEAEPAAAPNGGSRSLSAAPPGAAPSLVIPLPLLVLLLLPGRQCFRSAAHQKDERPALGCWRLQGLVRTFISDSTVRQALAVGVIDELTLDIAPVLLGSGERIFDGAQSFGCEPAEVLHSPLTTHIRYRRVT